MSKETDNIAVNQAQVDQARLNQAWIGQAKAVLDQSAEGLDAATLSRLNRVRQSALAGRTLRSTQRWLLPAGLASACLLLLAVAAWHKYPSSSVERLPSLPLSASGASNSGDIDLVSSDDSLELYQDLEFYAWLEAQDQGSDG